MAGDKEESFRLAIAELVAEWGVPCDESQTGALVRYGSLLLTWNARINLTGAGSLADLAGQHLPDSFALASRLAAAAEVVDIGSGGGLPAIPLGILRPRLGMRLIESRSKRVAFLRTAVRELGLGSRLAVEHARGEAVADARSGSFDVAISRATLTPQVWVDLATRLVGPGGRIFALLAGAATTPAGSNLELCFQRSYLAGGRRLVELRRRP
jgi:16S rRNA (guanine527-N7)-methyltransferase